MVAVNTSRGKELTITAGRQNTDWLYNSSFAQWTITSRSKYGTNGIYILGDGGNISDTNSEYSFGIRPTVYLKFNIVIAKGDGSSGNPYTLKLN